MNIYYVSNFSDVIPYKKWIIISENMQEAEEQSMNHFCGENWNLSDIDNIVSVKIGILKGLKNSKMLNQILIKE